MVRQSIKSQIWDHSNKVSTSKDFKRSAGPSMPFESTRIAFLPNKPHKTDPGTIFHTFEEKFSNQFLHAKSKEATILSITHYTPTIRKTSLHNSSMQRARATILSITHYTPTIRKTSLHNAWANLQWNRRWSTVSSSQWHKQHRFTSKFLTRLLIVRISSLAAYP